MTDSEQLKNLLSEPVIRPRKQGISVITAIMNRTEILSHSIQTWLDSDQISEVIVIDWSSTTPVADELPLDDERVQIIRVNEQKQWCLTKAYNLAARLANYNSLLKLDSDVLLLENFFECHKAQHDSFYAGNWTNAKTSNEIHLSGTFFMPTSSFFAVNGYNENIVTYGWDDDDLYNRLTVFGRKRLPLDYNTLYHLPHCNTRRVENQPGTKNPLNSIHKNMIMFSTDNRWTKYGVFSQFEIQDFPADQKGRARLIEKTAPFDNNKLPLI